MYKVIEEEILNPTATKMVVGAPAAARKALVEQFTTLRMHEDGERIPLTVADYDREKGTVTTIFQIVGKVTMLLNQPNVGDSILDFVGPLDKSSRVDGCKKVCVISGGVSCAIAYPTAKALHESGTKITVVTGFRNKGLVILEKEFKQVSAHTYLVSDGGSTGVKGLVTSMLEDLINEGESPDEVIAIGPLIIMESVCQLTKKYGIEAVVSMNPIMVDGTRMRGGYRLSASGEMKFACVDSPDFDGHPADFDEAMSCGATCRDFEARARDAACNLMSKEVR